MRVELNVPESVTEPRMWVQDQPVLIMALRTGSAEVGLRRSEMMRLTFGAGEMCLVPRHFETWVVMEQGAMWNYAEWKAWLTHELVRRPHNRSKT